MAVTLFILSLESAGQISKGTRLIGGNATFSSYHNKSQLFGTNDHLSIGIQPKIGLFFIDRFAGGLSLNWSFTKYKSPSVKVSELVIGPFLRYYFLPSANKVNIFGETSYQYGVRKQTGNPRVKSNNFSFLTGPVVFLNQSVGVEFTIGYTINKFVDYDGNNSMFQIGLGVQIHLDR